MAQTLGLVDYWHMIHRAWRYRLRTERDEIGFLLKQDLSGKLAVDIGANRGIYSYWMHKKVGDSGKVVSFEPQPEMVEALERLKGSFGLGSMEIVHSGLSSKPGELRLVRKPDHWGGASFEREPADDEESMIVPVTTLDQYSQDHFDRPVAFIKCDVEGHEPAVFRGSERVLREDKPILLFECHEHQVADGSFFGYLEGLGYGGHFFFKGRLCPLKDLAELRSQIDKPYLNYVFRSR
ncbi:MAG: FkbM family methyltransferase [Phycisphaerales bacterium]|nr:FkbM family methyltransferase [Phycisphaerales bacterium]